MTDEGLQTIDEEVKGKVGAFIALIFQVNDFTHIIGLAGKTFETGLLIEIEFEILVGREILVFFDGESGGEVDIARTSGHDGTLERRVAHGIFNRCAIFDGGNRGARADMTNDEFFGENINFAHVLNNGTNGKAVVAVTFDLMVIGKGGVDGIIAGDGGFGGVESAVRDSNNGSALEGFDELVNFASYDGDVKGGALFGDFELLEIIIVDEMIFGKEVARGGNAGKNGIEFLVGREEFFGGKDGLDGGDGGVEVGEGLVELFFGAVGGFDGADDRFIFKFKMERGKEVLALIESVFAGATTGVGDENKT